ncbi:MAG TPA: ferredoxin [Alphaproteobacteria bacterium]|nr:ferredoxin [Alphaproteobacteria bacterium]
MHLSSLTARITAAGLAFRGAFHPTEADDPPRLSGGAPARTIVLVGFAGPGDWPAFARSAEAADGLPDALDRWSRRVVSALADEADAIALFPFGGPPWLPFLRWARKAEPVHPSPLGLLIHPDWGLWHAYRGALAFAETIDLPPPDMRPSPCESCADKPCLAGCPVGAFTGAGYDVPKCKAHIASPVGSQCMESGCRARRACPVGRPYAPEEANFHMRAFLGARS